MASYKNVWIYPVFSGETELVKTINALQAMVLSWLGQIGPQVH